MPTSVKKLGLNRDNNISQCSLLEHICLLYTSDAADE